MREEGAMHVLISATGECEPEARRLQAVLPRSPGAITGAVVTHSPGLVKQPINKARPWSCLQLLTCSDDCLSDWVCVCVGGKAGQGLFGVYTDN